MRAPILALTMLLSPLPGAAQDVAGRFDYYVLALSWQPTWCSLTGDARDASECAPGSGAGFTVHGLWPQYESGWPQDCRTTRRDPTRRQTAAMTDVMGSAGLAWHQWQKHGRCSGLSATGYFDATRTALDRITLPPVFDDLARDMTVTPAVIEEAFLEANPDLTPDGITVTCKAGALTELRLCLTRELTPRACAPDTRRDCSSPGLVIEAVR